MTNADRFLMLTTRIVKLLAILGTALSIVAIVLTHKYEVLLFTGFAVSCAFYVDEVLQKRELEIVRAQPVRRLSVTATR